MLMQIKFHIKPFEYLLFMSNQESHYLLFNIKLKVNLFNLSWGIKDYKLI